MIVKNGRRICGTGAALANVEIFQDKCYFEVKIQSAGNEGKRCYLKLCQYVKI